MLRKIENWLVGDLGDYERSFLRRGGDSASGSIYGILRSGDWLGHALPVVSWIVVPFALVWAGLAVLIGIENKRLVKLQSSKTDQP